VYPCPVQIKRAAHKPDEHRTATAGTRAALLDRLSF
jgi:hypothetical protein